MGIIIFMYVHNVHNNYMAIVHMLIIMLSLLIYVYPFHDVYIVGPISQQTGGISQHDSVKIYTFQLVFGNLPRALNCP